MFVISGSGSFKGGLEGSGSFEGGLEGSGSFAGGLEACARGGRRLQREEWGRGRSGKERTEGERKAVMAAMAEMIVAQDNGGQLLLARP